ncbi:MAG: OmpA family protein [Gemmatimonadota bacterium]
MRRVPLLLIIGLIATAACHRAPVVQTPAPAPMVDDLAARTRADSIEAARRDRADSVAHVAAQRAEAARLATLRAALTDTLTARVHFDFDQTEIRPADRILLARKAAILVANHALVLRVAGHADERGSDEYNLALGSRRAASVRIFLMNHGVAPDRLVTSSSGEEQPLVAGHNESDWAMNRRDEFTPGQGAEALVPPGMSQ